MEKCEMKGFLSFIMLWLISKKAMTGTDIALEIKKRKGTKPSPGTIYPALKYLRNKGLIKVNQKKTYTLTRAGKKELESQLNFFFGTFCDLDEMKACCKSLKQQNKRYI